jgi:hypothetical protein
VIDIAAWSRGGGIFRAPNTTDSSSSSSSNDGTTNVTTDDGSSSPSSSAEISAAGDSSNDAPDDPSDATSTDNSDNDSDTTSADAANSSSTTPTPPSDSTDSAASSSLGRKDYGTGKGGAGGSSKPDFSGPPQSLGQLLSGMLSNPFSNLAEVTNRVIGGRAVQKGRWVGHLRMCIVNMHGSNCNCCVRCCASVSLWVYTVATQSMPGTYHFMPSSSQTSASTTVLPAAQHSACIQPGGGAAAKHYP